MAAEVPPGVHPLFLRGVTCEKYGMKTGEGVNDLVPYKMMDKAEIMNEIQTMGVMSDFEPAKKKIESYPGEQILFVVDKAQKYGETFLVCYTEEAREDFMKSLMEEENALKEQLLAEQRAEEERIAAEYARKNVVYEDKPIIPRAWVSENSAEIDAEIRSLVPVPSRELLVIEVMRPKRYTKNPKYRFSDRNAENNLQAEYRAVKDPNFKLMRESEMGIQVAPAMSSSSSQTTWNKPVNKAVQYESASFGTDPLEGDSRDYLFEFLEKATVKIEEALQQNESVDIFNETFRMVGDDDAQGGVQADSELKELRNFADPTYSKNKALQAIDWVPKAQGLVAVSAVASQSFDARIPSFGQSGTSHILLWDFRLLVKPLILMQSNHDIFTFRFNRTDPHIVAGGCTTGQVVLWETGDAVAAALRKNSRSGGAAAASAAQEEEDEQASMPVAPKYVSSVDHSHKKCVADLFWLPPTTQINYRGQLVADEHLDGHSYQFVTVAGDGLILVWDTRFEQIANDELRHIGRAKHAPVEKVSNKDKETAGPPKPLWWPIFRAHLKRLDGVGELSLCKVTSLSNPADGLPVASSSKSGMTVEGDNRSQFSVTTEEGDVLFADVSVRKVAGGGGKGNEEDEDVDEGEVSCMKWIASDHPRPCVHLQESPFFPGIILSVSDWNFHIWKIGQDKPLFIAPMSHTYLTAGAWSTTRPAVLYIACADGQILVWDFTDSSFRCSIELKATHSKITSMEFLNSTASARFQMLAVGDEIGTLHVFEVPRNLTRPVHNEVAIMQKFLEREHQRWEFTKAAAMADSGVVEAESADRMAGLMNDEDGAADGAADPMATSGGIGDTDATGGADYAAGTESDEKKVSERANQKKQDEEFLKMEAAFISELGLGPDQLPSFAMQPSAAEKK